jgi:outer membrane protein OmpA-like peptidoglycan-associated protein
MQTVRKGEKGFTRMLETKKPRVTEMPINRVYRNVAAANCILLIGMLLLNGCAPLLLVSGGIAASVALVASFHNGMVVEIYDADYPLMISETRETLKSLNISISETVGDDLKTTFTATRTDETPVSIEVLRVSAGRTQIGIRTGSIGVTELDSSQKVHANIRDRLAPKAMREDPVEPTELRFSSNYRTIKAPPNPEPVKGRRKEVRDVPKSGPSAKAIIYFDPGSDELSEAQYQKLEGIVATLNARPKATVTLNGYANANDLSDYNRTISEGAANTVKMYMVARGIDARRIRVIGREHRNSVPLRAEEPQPLVHRVEIAFDAK